MNIPNVLKKISISDEMKEYIESYIMRVILAFDDKLEFVDYSMCRTIDTDHHVFEFKLKESIVTAIDITDEQRKVLFEDDDSQPHNQYRIYLKSLYIYSTRTH
jgi:hypothetical protein